MKQENYYETLHKFRYDLLDTVYDLRAQLKRTDRALEEIAAFWKGMQFQKFNKEFGKDKEKIESFCKDIETFDEEVLRPLERVIIDYI